MNLKTVHWAINMFILNDSAACLLLMSFISFCLFVYLLNKRLCVENSEHFVPLSKGLCFFVKYWYRQCIPCIKLESYPTVAVWTEQKKGCRIQRTSHFLHWKSVASRVETICPLINQCFHRKYTASQNKIVAGFEIRNICWFSFLFSEHLPIKQNLSLGLWDVLYTYFWHLGFKDHVSVPTCHCPLPTSAT